ncbi:MAG: hypothetical protein EWV50_19530 [Microcystis aeruginosa Ma_MB_F_20061100_S20]|uniref:Uncharacterized protein n=1 Tax=Microcystis aeruginosa Ma_MB_F_20061100_S20D TaxID=2486253 RepID=A0A552EWD5_MICAE|nr:MAG: hypothetical protein EWV50_19530 [Microcystis aeruginosa Ma_MB_F_20061100_S20]TRU38772.1 MAG: hypothetical protein EWV78_04325 [Microcystis aeruginosa Ma_MB_F_20061100_S20D]
MMGNGDRFLRMRRGDRFLGNGDRFLRMRSAIAFWGMRRGDRFWVMWEWRSHIVFFYYHSKIRQIF